MFQGWIKVVMLVLLAVPVVISILTQEQNLDKTYRKSV
jgi:hypothetical protein